MGFLATQNAENATVAVEDSLNVTVTNEDVLNDAVLEGPVEEENDSVMVGAPVTVHATAVAGINYVG